MSQIPGNASRILVAAALEQGLLSAKDSDAERFRLIATPPDMNVVIQCQAYF